MTEAQEILLHIAYSLQNQNQAVTLKAIQQSLGLTQGHSFDLETTMARLVARGLLAEEGEAQFVLAGTGRSVALKISKARAKSEFNRLIERSVNSAAYLDFCEEAHGYRMPLFNMMDKPQLDYLFNTMAVASHDTVLDLGCGTGAILDRLVRQYKCNGIGIDQLFGATVKRCSRLITYLEGDIDDLAGYHLEPTITLAVDSLYFSADLDGLVKRLKDMENNRLYFFYSQYIFDPANQDRGVLHRDRTRLARVLARNELPYQAVDYSANEAALYANARRILPKYENAFTSEGNSELYETKTKESAIGQDMYDRGLASRHLYIAE